MIHVLKDIVPLEYQELLKEKIKNKYNDWGSNNITAWANGAVFSKVDTPDINIIDRGQKVLQVYTDKRRRWSEDNIIFNNYVNPLIKLAFTKANIKYNKVVRAKFNILTKDPNFKKENYNTPHIDIEEDPGTYKFYSMIYYVNNSDGDTVFFDEQNNITHRETPEQGKVIIFNSVILHASCNPSISEARVVLSVICYDDSVSSHQP